MKSRRIAIAIFWVLLLCLLAAWWFLRSPKEREGQTAVGKQKRHLSNSSQNEKAISGWEAKAKSKREELRKQFNLLNDQQIEFYGKAIDQYGQPVADADVIGNILVRNGSREGIEKVQSKTDANGCFAIKGYAGESLEVGVRKVPGYYNGRVDGELTQGFLAKYSLMYRDEVHKPDSAKPVVFNMWKLAGAEPMVENKYAFIRVPYDGKVSLVDLATGKKVNHGGDLRVSVWQAPLAKDGRQKKGDWLCALEAIGGGLQESQDRFMYLAPESGYQPKIEAKMLATSTNWNRTFTKDFYIKSRNGQCYGRIKLQVWCEYDRPDTAIEFDSWLNPGGSRNLEYDSSKRISPSRIAEVGLEKAIEEVKAKAAK